MSSDKLHFLRDHPGSVDDAARTAVGAGIGAATYGVATRQKLFDPVHTSVRELLQRMPEFQKLVASSPTAQPWFARLAARSPAVAKSLLHVARATPAAGLIGLPAAAGLLAPKILDKAGL